MLVDHQTQCIITYKTFMLKICSIVIKLIPMIISIMFLVSLSKASSIFKSKELIKQAWLVVRKWTYLKLNLRVPTNP